MWSFYFVSEASFLELSKGIGELGSSIKDLRQSFRSLVISTAVSFGMMIGALICILMTLVGIIVLK